MISKRRLALPFAAFALALLAAASASAAASCPKTPGGLAGNSFGRVWHQGSSLYSCTTVYAHKPRARRLGPWDPKTRLAFDGVNVAWTTPLTRAGVRSDRVWAASADTGKRWLSGSPLLPGRAEARVQRILQTDRGAAWITRTGDVVLALQSPESTPTAIGTLPGPLVPDHQLLLVGSWPDVPTVQLAATAKLAELEGDGDECGGTNPYQLTVSPDAAAPELGAEWWGGWTSTNCS